MKDQKSFMERRGIPEILLFLAAILLFALAGVFLRVPGYMDADYYYMNGQRLVSGHGYTEMVIWNFLDNPQELPHASHTYWLPLTSMIAALGLFLSKNHQFINAQLPFILFSAFMPVITYKTALLLYTDRKKALFAGILALFSGFYLAYQVTTSTISLYMLEGGLFFWLLLTIVQNKKLADRSTLRFLGLGCISGTMYLTRSDGILWLFGAVIFAVYIAIRHGQRIRQRRELVKRIAILVVIVFLGFILVMGFWFYHNWVEFGKLMPPGGLSTLWLQDYNQMFSFPPDPLNFQTWLKSGFGDILANRLKSTLENFKTLIGVEAEIILLPLLCIGIIRKISNPAIKLMLFIWVLTFGLMSWIFPFAGMRGGFFHSSAAFQPFIWSVIPEGYTQFIRWGVKKRNWEEMKAFRNFGICLCVVLAVFTVSIYYSKVIGSDLNSPAWQTDQIIYSRVESAIENVTSDHDAVIIVNNPPSYNLASGGRPAIVLPDGDEQTLRSVVDKFHAQFIAIDRNTVDELKPLYQNPESSQWYEYLFTIDDVRIYRVRGSE